MVVINMILTVILLCFVINISKYSEYFDNKSHKKSNKHLDLETKMAGNLVLSDCFKSTQPQKIANKCTSNTVIHLLTHDSLCLCFSDKQKEKNYQTFLNTGINISRILL
jgi:hypothetical protein